MLDTDVMGSCGVEERASIFRISHLSLLKKCLLQDFPENVSNPAAKLTFMSVALGSSRFIRSLAIELS